MGRLPQIVAVLGAGQMGGGIAQVLASAGLRVRLIDKSPDQLLRAKDTITKSLSLLSEKGKLKEDPSLVLQRLDTATAMEVKKKLE